MNWHDNDDSLPLQSISYQVDSEERSSSGASSGNSLTVSSIDNSIDSSHKISQSFISQKSNSLFQSDKSIEKESKSSESIIVKTPAQHRRFQVNKSIKNFPTLSDQTNINVAGMPGNKEICPGLQKLAESIRIQISPPDEENKEVGAANNNQVRAVA